MRKSRNQNAKTGGAATIEAHPHISLQLVRELLLEIKCASLPFSSTSYANAARFSTLQVSKRCVILATELIIFP